MNALVPWYKFQGQSLTLFAVLISLAGCIQAEPAGSPAGILPAEQPSTTLETPQIEWQSLFKQTMFFLGIEHSFRFATEPGTRDGVRRVSFGRYANAIGNLHGWSDGDPLYVNYVGHPMQGAVTGYIWAQNDSAFRRVEFGKSPAYWKSRIRAGAFAAAYSEQFEIGLVSEASIGHIQSHFPQQGLVDHVVTPVVGLGWMIAEDAIDKYVIKRFESHVTNRWARLFVRGGLNPTRSVANAVAGNAPWHRDTREGVERYRADLASTPASADDSDDFDRGDGLAPVEFNTQAAFWNFRGAGPCAGGGASMAFRVAESVQLVADVSGCKLLRMQANQSGDSLTYLAGPRWTLAPNRRLTPHFELLVGGHKMTAEQMFPDRKLALQAAGVLDKMDAAEAHALYARTTEVNGPAIAVGGGLHWTMNRALAFRLADVQYLHSWTPALDSLDGSGSFRVTAGLILRMGTW